MPKPVPVTKPKKHARPMRMAEEQQQITAHCAGAPTWSHAVPICGCSCCPEQQSNSPGSQQAKETELQDRATCGQNPCSILFTTSGAAHEDKGNHLALKGQAPGQELLMHL